MINGKPLIYGIEKSKNGCTFYRVTQPLRKIMERDTFPCAYSSELKGDEPELYLGQCDILMTQPVLSETFLEFMAEWKGKKKMVLDYDDNIFEVSPFNPSYQFHGTREVDIEMPNGSKLEIRDGQNGFDLAANKKRLFIFQEALKMADLVLTPSPILSGIFKQFNKNVRVIKNLIDFNLWSPIKMQKDGTIRIGWQGGHSHFSDFVDMQSIMPEIMAKYPQVHFVIMGRDFKGMTQFLPQDRVHVETWVDIDVYPWKFKTLNLDIGIAPLEDNRFNNAKSAIKWEEYSALKIPCVASNVLPYSTAIRDAETGFLCSTKEEWIAALSVLIENAALRECIGQKAHDAVKQDYNLDTKIEEYERAFKSLYQKELILR